MRSRKRVFQDTLNTEKNRHSDNVKQTKNKVIKLQPSKTEANKRVTRSSKNSGSQVSTSKNTVCDDNNLKSYRLIVSKAKNITVPVESSLMIIDGNKDANEMSNNLEKNTELKTRKDLKILKTAKNKKCTKFVSSVKTRSMTNSVMIDKQLNKPKKSKNLKTSKTTKTKTFSSITSTKTKSQSNNNGNKNDVQIKSIEICNDLARLKSSNFVISGKTKYRLKSKIKNNISEVFKKKRQSKVPQKRVRFLVNKTQSTNYKQISTYNRRTKLNFFSKILYKKQLKVVFEKCDKIQSLSKYDEEKEKWNNKRSENKVSNCENTIKKKLKIKKTSICKNLKTNMLEKLDTNGSLLVNISNTCNNVKISNIPKTQNELVTNSSTVIKPFSLNNANFVPSKISDFEPHCLDATLLSNVSQIPITPTTVPLSCSTPLSSSTLSSTSVMSTSMSFKLSSTTTNPSKCSIIPSFFPRIPTLTTPSIYVSQPSKLPKLMPSSTTTTLSTFSRLPSTLTKVSNTAYASENYLQPHLITNGSMNNTSSTIINQSLNNTTTNSVKQSTIYPYQNNTGPQSIFCNILASSQENNTNKPDEVYKCRLENNKQSNENEEQLSISDKILLFSKYVPSEKLKEIVLISLMKVVSEKMPSWTLTSSTNPPRYVISHVNINKYGAPFINKSIVLDEYFRASVRIHQCLLHKYCKRYESVSEIYNLIEELNSLGAI